MICGKIFLEMVLISFRITWKYIINMLSIIKANGIELNLRMNITTNKTNKQEGIVINQGGIVTKRRSYVNNKEYIK